MKKKLFPFVLSALMLFPNIGFGQTHFTDVAGHWAASEIETIYQKGYLKGISSDKFSPNTQVSRTELATALDRIFEFNSHDLKIITQANPNQPVTRLEIAKAINDSFKAKNLGLITTLMMPVYEDTLNLSQEDQNIIVLIFNTGIMKGKTTQNFHPHDNVTRAELAVILNRTLNAKQYAFPLKEESDTQQKTDLRGKIMDITTGEENTELFIEGPIEKDTLYDKARVRITEETLFMKGPSEISLQDLKTDLNVEVEFTGPVTKSYPAIGTAKVIRVIE
ncbi:S-layer homology domain-containing protein [Desulfotomaculum sp. 1211_IL3151]|uniref:S-layer homology domain-containing protein n=1 Tax=Desulfotomaculum sp. 1211_IL3151 TaxID=3084055 RepID=UPI002FDB0E0F